MSALTRRRVHDRQSEHWLIFDDKIEIGCIGLPSHVDQWQWTISFLPPSHRGVRAEGTARDFRAAREAFEQAWRHIAPEIAEADRFEHLRRNAHIAWKYKMWDTRCRLPTQAANGRSRCYCGAEITIANVDSIPPPAAPQTNDLGPSTNEPEQKTENGAVARSEEARLGDDSRNPRRSRHGRCRERSSPSCLRPRPGALGFHQ